MMNSLARALTRTNANLCSLQASIIFGVDLH